MINYLQARSKWVHMTLFANHYCMVQLVRTDSKTSKGTSKLKYFNMKAAFSFLYSDGNAWHLFIIEMLCGATQSNFWFLVLFPLFIGGNSNGNKTIFRNSLLKTGTNLHCRHSVQFLSVNNIFSHTFPCVYKHADYSPLPGTRPNSGHRETRMRNPRGPWKSVTVEGGRKTKCFYESLYHSAGGM